MSRLVTWRLALRLARREALRNRGRSILVLVMIALPVLAVTAADIVIQTQSVSGVEGLDRRLGSAAAQVVVPAGGHPVVQAFDPYDGNTSVGRGGKATMPTEADVSDALGGARLVEMRSGGLDVRTDAGYGYAEATEVDLSDPVAAGLFDLRSGRLPTSADEVVVSPALLAKGYAVGDRLEVRGKNAPSPVIVGVAESTTTRDYSVVAGPIGSLGLSAGGGSGPSWLVAGGPVSWDTVKALNAMGATVLSRAVVEDPPPSSEIPEEIRAWNTGTDASAVAVVVLVVVMALLEVVLLAGPAFAVSARRQARSLALMSAAGGTPAQSRRVVLAGGVVLGGTAALIGVVAGIGLGWLLVPVVQRWSNTWFGPFDVPWLHLVGIAAFGLASALLAAVVPAWIASRQDVVAVLAGRRADRPPSVRSPILGLVLLGVGIAGSAYGTQARQGGEFFIAGSAVIAILGMILVVPVVVAGIARLARRLPLSTRYATRDAARHRTRTVPAVAAVAATVAGVVALGIAVTSDAAEQEAQYTPQLPMGVASVNDYSVRPHWDELQATIADRAPSVDVDVVPGVPESRAFAELTARRDGRRLPLDSYGGAIGSSLLVDDGTGVARLPGVPAAAVDAAERVLASGGAVVFTNAADAEGSMELTSRFQAHHQPAVKGRAILPTLAVHVPSSTIGPRAVLSPEAAGALELPTSTVGLVFDASDVGATQEQGLSEAISAVSLNASLYVEHGYRADQATLIVQLVLAGLGAVLMLGGTLTATFLALSDARPDLATLSAVGASPRRRRGIAASYALVIGFVGALLGALVGFIPGIAIVYPLTSTSWGAIASDGTAEHSYGPYLDVPWLLVIGLVVGLPLVTAAIVGLCTRSRLPVVARLG